MGAKSIGLNISLPAEQMPNPYITPDLCFQFHYFALRKMHFLLRARRWSRFRAATARWTNSSTRSRCGKRGGCRRFPIILYGREYWEQVIDLDFLLAEGMIDEEHLRLVSYADTPAEAWQIITQFHDAKRPPENLAMPGALCGLPEKWRSTSEPGGRFSRKLISGEVSAPAIFDRLLSQLGDQLLQPAAVLEVLHLEQVPRRADVANSRAGSTAPHRFSRRNLAAQAGLLRHAWMKRAMSCA